MRLHWRYILRSTVRQDNWSGRIQNVLNLLEQFVSPLLHKLVSLTLLLINLDESFHSVLVFPVVTTQRDLVHVRVKIIIACVSDLSEIGHLIIGLSAFVLINKTSHGFLQINWISPRLTSASNYSCGLQTSIQNLFLFWWLSNTRSSNIARQLHLLNFLCMLYIWILNKHIFCREILVIILLNHLWRLRLQWWLHEIGRSGVMRLSLWFGWVTANIWKLLDERL